MTRIEVVNITGGGASSMVGRRTERWAYAGLRAYGSRRIHAWLADAGAGNGLLIEMTGSFSVGRVYLVDVSDVEGAVHVRGIPRLVGDERVSASLAVWLRAAHRAALDRLTAARDERAANPCAELDVVLEPLRAMARTKRTPADATAFITHVVRELWAAFYASHEAPEKGVGGRG